MRKYRWIMYLSQPLPGAFDVIRIRSHAEARAQLIAYGVNTGFHQDLTVNGDYGPTAALYPYTDEDWAEAEAERMRGVGNPFDYPSYLVQSGPRGGVRVTPA